MLSTPNTSPPRVLSTASRPTLVGKKSNYNFGVESGSDRSHGASGSSNSTSNGIRNSERNEGSSTSFDGRKNNKMEERNRAAGGGGSGSGGSERGRSNSSTRVEDDDTSIEGGRRKRLQSSTSSSTTSSSSTTANSSTSKVSHPRLPRSHSSTHPTPRSRSKPRSATTLPALVIPTLPPPSASTSSLPTPLTGSCCPGFVEKSCDPTLSATSTEIAHGEQTCDYRRRKAGEVLEELFYGENEENINEEPHQFVPYYESSLPLPQSSLPSPHSSPRSRSTSSRHRSPSASSTSTVHQIKAVGTSISRTRSSSRAMSTSPVRDDNFKSDTSNHNLRKPDEDDELKSLSGDSLPKGDEVEEVEEVKSRPSLHSYTSFEQTFDLHPPPSPPPSPKAETGKAWWRG